jgi:hypothetical protein
MDRFARLLWEVGPELGEAVRDAFVALKYEVELISDQGSDISVQLDSKRRLLVHVAAGDQMIQKKGAELARVVELMQGVAEDSDRVVLVANIDPETRPADRGDCMGPGALDFLRRMGANLLMGPTLFKLWSLSLQDYDRAHKQIERLHAQDGGEFSFQSS